MYSTLISLHSLVRWFFLILLLVSVYRATVVYFGERRFTIMDNLLRHRTATLGHIQLVIGMILYFQSPITSYFWKNFSEALEVHDMLFFGLIHPLLMLIALVVITIGSAKAKRKQTDKGKSGTMLIWFLITLIIIFIAVPWPFSPFTGRPYYRAF